MAHMLTNNIYSPRTVLLPAAISYFNFYRIILTIPSWLKFKLEIAMVGIIVTTRSII